MGQKKNEMGSSTVPSLCIGIPTYNRPEALCRRISEVNRYSDLVDELLIYDNSETTSPLVTEMLNGVTLKCTYVKNPVNIGAGANFLRVLENASTDYLWWRGDDDVISPEQVAAVTSSLSTTPQLILISNSAKEIFSSQGLESFVDNFKRVEPMTWASQVVVPVEIAKKVLAWGYTAIDWAHIAIILRLFQICPNLRFIVIPYTLRDDEFRDIGREGQRWAFFYTCITKFPDTALGLPTESLKKRYIRNWQKTKDFSLIRTMVGMKLGVSTQEKITLSTFYPLLTLANPKSTLLGIILYVMSLVPCHIYQIVFSFIWLRLSVEKKVRYRLDFLMQCTTFLSVYRAMRDNAPAHRL